MKERLLKMVDRLRASKGEAKYHPFLSEIIDSLLVMAENTKAPQEIKMQMLRGIGRLATEYIAFCDSPLGGEFFSLIHEFAGIELEPER